jgi:DNA-directed RNA polymerase subunit RPC12/RpoP
MSEPEPEYMCTACGDRLHDLCEDHECTCDEAEHPDRPVAT